MDNLEKIKCQKMADDIAKIIKITPGLYAALCAVPRSPFVPVARYAFDLNPHPIAGNQFISSPLTVAKMTMALELENGGQKCDKVLEIGCGSGYQAVILSQIAGRVFSVERIATLASTAKNLVKNLEIFNVFIRHDDGNLGWSSYAPFDRILLSCAAQNVPERLFSQLKDGGILVAPMEINKTQKIVKFIKTGSNLEQIILDECDFVPLLSGRE